jgi:DNA-binding HxlR family transcriptional regulator
MASSVRTVVSVVNQVPTGNLSLIVKDADTPCFALSPVLEVFAARWKPEILWHLRRGPRRFNELKRLVAPVSQKMLAAQLRALERDGLVVRKQYPEVPARVEYAATALGTSTHRVLEEVYVWWRDRWPQVERARRRRRASASGRSGR